MGTSPDALAFDPANDDLYVANFDADLVTIVSAASDSVLGSVPVGTEPDGVAFDSADGSIYVANYGSNNVSVINGSTNLIARLYRGRRRTEGHRL